MKKICCLVFSLSAFLSSAQNTNEIVFNKKINYKFETAESANSNSDEFSNVNYDFYLSKNNKEGLLSFYYVEQPYETYASNESNYFITKNTMIPVTISGISKGISASYYAAFNIINNSRKLIKLDRKATYSGINCQLYAIANDSNNKDEYEYCFCIDENNKLNNAETLFPDSKIKGLIVAVEYKLDDTYRIVYRSSENSDLKLTFDTEKVFEEIEAYQSGLVSTDSVNAVELTEDLSDYTNVYSDPLYTYDAIDGIEDYNLYNFITPIYSITSHFLFNTEEYGGEANIKRDQIATFFKKETKSLVKNLNASKLINAEQKKILNTFFKEQNQKIKNFVPNQTDTSSAVDTAEEWSVTDSVAYADSYDYYTKYQSTYNDITVDNIELAYDIDVVNNDEIKKYAPEYCDNLKNKVPNFQNANLKAHVHNLVGQICDLYLYNNGGNVGYFETINSMRKSYLEIEKLRNSLSQKDQKLLLEFIKNLD